MHKQAIKSTVATAKQRMLPAIAFLKKNRRAILFAFAFAFPLPFALSFTIPYAREEEGILLYALLGLLFYVPLSFFFSFLLSKLGKVTPSTPFYVFLVWLVIQLGQSIGLPEAGTVALVPFAHMLFMAIVCFWCTVKPFYITRSKLILVIAYSEWPSKLPSVSASTQTFAAT